MFHPSKDMMGPPGDEASAHPATRWIIYDSTGQCVWLCVCVYKSTRERALVGVTEWSVHFVAWLYFRSALSCLQLYIVCDALCVCLYAFVCTLCLLCSFIKKLPFFLIGKSNILYLTKNQCQKICTFFVPEQNLQEHILIKVKNCLFWLVTKSPDLLLVNDTGRLRSILYITKVSYHLPKLARISILNTQFSPTDSVPN